MQGPDAQGVQYALVGVVEHRGSQLSSGHYAAYVQRGLQSPLQHAAAPPATQSQPSATSAEAVEPAAEAKEQGAGVDSSQPSAEAAAPAQAAAPTAQERRWFYASDAMVTPATQEAVAACEAYILLYMRVDVGGEA